MQRLCSTLLLKVKVHLTSALVFHLCLKGLLLRGIGCSTGTCSVGWYLLITVDCFNQSFYLAIFGVASHTS